MKRVLTSLIPLGLVLSASAFAAAPMLPEEIPVVEEHDRFVIGGEVNYFRQSQAKLNFAFTEDVYGNQTIHYLDPDFDCCGGRLFASYMFTNENDIQLAWMHFDGSDDDKVHIYEDVVSWGAAPPFHDFDFGHIVPDTFRLEKETEIDAVDLDMGRIFHNENYMVRIFAGARYLSLDDELSMHVSDENNVYCARGKSELDAIGVRGGFDARYRLMDHLSLTGHAAVALLKGFIDAKSDFPGEPDGFHVKTNDDIQRMVPNIDARLGLAVDFAFDNGWGVVFEGGWHSEHFFNASTVALLDGGATNRDVSVYGPYLGLAVMFS